MADLIDFNEPAQFRVHLSVCAGDSCRTCGLSFFHWKRCRSSTTDSCKCATGWVWLNIKGIDRIAGQRPCTRTEIFCRARSYTKSGLFSNKFLLWLRRQREIVCWFGPSGSGLASLSSARRTNLVLKWVEMQLLVHKPLTSSSRRQESGSHFTWGMNLSCAGYLLQCSFGCLCRRFLQNMRLILLSLEKVQKFHHR